VPSLVGTHGGGLSPHHGRLGIAEVVTGLGRHPDPGDRIAIAGGLQVKESTKEIAASVGKSFQTVYREFKRNRKPDGHYWPWWTHNQALLRRKHPKSEKIRVSEPLRTTVREQLVGRVPGPGLHGRVAEADPGVGRQA
jgi:hypothetical protein